MENEWNRSNSHCKRVDTAVCARVNAFLSNDFNWSAYWYKSDAFVYLSNICWCTCRFIRVLWWNSHSFTLLVMILYFRLFYSMYASPHARTYVKQFFFHSCTIMFSFFVLSTVGKHIHCVLYMSSFLYNSRGESSYRTESSVVCLLAISSVWFDRYL